MARSKRMHWPPTTADGHRGWRELHRALRPYGGGDCEASSCRFRFEVCAERPRPLRKLDCLGKLLPRYPALRTGLATGVPFSGGGADGPHGASASVHRNRRAPGTQGNPCLTATYALGQRECLPGVVPACGFAHRHVCVPAPPLRPQGYALHAMLPTGTLSRTRVKVVLRPLVNLPRPLWGHASLLRVTAEYGLSQQPRRTAQLFPLR
jgi:hypothetical protein